MDSFSQTTSCWNTFACGERSHVEKRWSTFNTISKWLAPKQAPSRPVYLDEVVHCTLSAYGFEPDSVSTPSIIHAVCMWDSPMVCACVRFQASSAVESPRGPASVAIITAVAPLSLAVLSSVNMTEKGEVMCNTTQHNKLPREGEHIQICPCIKY